MAIHEVGLGAESLERLSEAVRELFPLLWFQPEQIQSFLDSLRDGKPPERIALVESARGEAFVGENRGRVAFVIPADPHSRYEAVRECIKELQGEQGRKYIDMDINEAVPSHSGYFAGLLPGLGFGMEPRVEMVADGDVVDDVTAELPAGFAELTLTTDRASQAARVLHEAYLTAHPDWSPERREDEWKSWSQFMQFTSPAEFRDEWVAVEHEGTVVGVCAVFSRPDAMIISELAVLPEHFRKGVGRYLLVRAMQKVKGARGSDGQYLLSTLRRRESRAAVGLYRSVGFTEKKVFTRASWRP